MRLCKSSSLNAHPSLDIDRPSRFNLTPQRMRMIVEAFKDSLELGLAKPDQIVVSLPFLRAFASRRRDGSVDASR